MNCCISRKMREVFFLSFIFMVLEVDTFFTIVGSRTFLLGSDYELFLTQTHEENSSLKLELELQGEKFGERFLKTITLDFQQRHVKFDVSL